MPINYGDGVELDTLDKNIMPKLRGWRNDRRIWHWCRQHDLITEADHQKWYEWQDADRSTRMYAIRAVNPVGVAGLTSLDPVNRRAEFSLYIGPEHRGEGYGRKALCTLLTHGFQNLGLNSIWGEVFADNPAMRVFESLGFVREGARRDFYFRGGKFIDAHLISMRADEWKALSLKRSS